MGIDYDGVMIVGCAAEDIDLGEYDCATEFAEHNNLDYYSLWYDAGDEGIVVGFCVEDVDPLSCDFEQWCNNVKDKAVEFKELTGSDAKLIGMQNIW